MKTSIYSLLVALASALTFSACDNWEPEGASSSNTGDISSVNMNVAVNEAANAISRAEGRNIDTSNFIVTITDKNNKEVSYNGNECKWTYGSMPEIITLPIGQYYVNVISHNPEPAAWETPYYEGASELFTVENNKVNYIGTVTCNFSAVKVEVRFSEEFIKAMDATSKVDVKAGVAGTSLSWSSTEKRIGYFCIEPGNNTLVAEFSGKLRGTETSAIKEITDVKAGNYYVINFSLKAGDPTLPPEYGDITGANGGISIDYDVVESDITGTVKPGTDPSDPDKHPDTEEWPDNPNPPVDPEDPDQPKDDTISIKYDFGENNDKPGFDPEGIISITGNTYILKFQSQEPIENLKVKIESPFLTPDELANIGLIQEFDLANPGELEDTLKSINFPTGDDVKGHTDEIIFDLSGFIPLLSAGDAGDIHTFTITIEDNKGNVMIKDLKFRS